MPEQIRSLNSRIYQVVVVIILIASSLSVILTQRERLLVTRTYHSGVLVIDNLTSELHDSLFASGLLSVDSSSPKSKALFDQAKTVTKAEVRAPFLMVREEAAGPVKVFTSPESINAILRELHSRRASETRDLRAPLLFIVSLLAGLCLSRLRHIPLYAPATLLILACLAFAQYNATCKSCSSTPQELGVPVGLLAGYSFSALCAVSILVPQLYWLASTGLLVSVLWQLKLLWIYPTGCVYCIAIAVLSCIHLASLALVLPERRAGMISDHTAHTFVRWKRLILVLLVAACLSPLTSKDAPMVAQATRYEPLANRITIGAPVQGIPFEGALAKTPSHPTLILVGSSDCAPCRAALRWVATNYPNRYLACSGHGRPQAKDDAFSESWLTSRISAVSPTFIVVNEGKVSYYSEGWADDPTFEFSLKNDIDRALANHKENAR